jgi:hypothetical protein
MSSKMSQEFESGQPCLQSLSPLSSRHALAVHALQHRHAPLSPPPSGTPQRQLMSRSQRPHILGRRPGRDGNAAWPLGGVTGIVAAQAELSLGRIGRGLGARRDRHGRRLHRLLADQVRDLTQEAAGFAPLR